MAYRAGGVFHSLALSQVPRPLSTASLKGRDAPVVLMTPMGKLRQKGKCAASTPGGGSGCGPRILCIVSCFSKFPGELIGVPPPEGPCEGVRDVSPLPCSCLLPHLSDLLPSCSLGSDKPNLDCVKGEQSLARD